MIVWGIVDINDDRLNIELENGRLRNIILSYSNLLSDLNN